MIFSFNKIYVVESLGDHETKTGTNLFNDIIARHVSRIDQMHCELVEIGNRHDLFAFFTAVQQATFSKGTKPYIHFEVHGSPTGFTLRSGEGVSWAELQDEFIKINVSAHNNLWLSLATCYGAYIFSLILPSKPAPFFGFTGAWEEINVSDLEASYADYFDVFLTSFNVNKALDALNRENPNLPVEYKIYHSSEVFSSTYAKYELENYQPVAFAKRVNTLLKELKSKLPLKMNSKDEKRYRKEITARLIQDKPKFKQQFMDIFLMLNIYPEQTERYDL